MKTLTRREGKPRASGRPEPLETKRPEGSAIQDCLNCDPGRSKMQGREKRG